ncbi:alpha/beta hydrolase family protein [Cognatilysobacter segetis]|uniref:alpha/beta hydrolase family protein n=1 Tax=Cognatilysobacter segetis TaxID=2492394 RepID=UPI001060B0E5|nr:prolyl oligopeptidase family serine peptidase [Lysobacter segetis]
MSTWGRRAAAVGLVLCFQASADPVRIDDLARHAELNEASLSPSGDYVALAVPSKDGKETQLEILKLDGSGSTQVLRFPLKQHVIDIVWTSDEQIVIARARNRPFKPLPVSYGELLTTDINGKHQDLLFGYQPDGLTYPGRRKDQGFASVAKLLPDEPGKMLVEFTCWNCGDEPDTAIYKVDSVTGERSEIERSKGPGRFLFDRSGRARIRTTYDAQDEPVLAYRRTPTSDWRPMPRNLVGYDVTGGLFTADPNVALLEIADGGENAKMYRVDMSAGTRTPLASHADLEYTTLLRAGYSGEPFGAMYTSGKPSVKYFDPASEWAKLHAGLMKAFPGELVGIAGVSRDGQRVLFTVTSDRHPGAYYLLDRRANKVSLIGERAPWIKPDAMATSVPVEFTARDGRRIYGFYTTSSDDPRPLILMPHGGPFGIADTWGYDVDAQFLASRGYAVLQVNYRGSGGRGAQFQRDGWTHWGDLLINDMVDGVKWAKAQKLVDGDRVCVYGVSYGGYAALQASRVQPDLFKCAIGYAGVYDLALAQKRISNDGSQRYVARTMGADAAVLSAMSPALHADEVKLPVFLVHGKDDQTAHIDQYDAMRKAMLAAGNVPETYVVPGEGHGFYSPESQAELYRRMEAFLAKHLPAGH